MKLISIGFLLMLSIVGCAKVPSPGSDLAKKIVQLMDKYLPELRLTIVTDEICNIATERSLQKASDELKELNPKNMDRRCGPPVGSDWIIQSGIQPRCAVSSQPVFADLCE